MIAHVLQGLFGLLLLDVALVLWLLAQAVSAPEAPPDA